MMFYSLAVVLGLTTVWILSVVWAYFILLSVPQTDGEYNLRKYAFSLLFFFSLCARRQKLLIYISSFQCISQRGHRDHTACRHHARVRPDLLVDILRRERLHRDLGERQLFDDGNIPQAYSYLYYNEHFEKHTLEKFPSFLPSSILYFSFLYCIQLNS